MNRSGPRSGVVGAGGILFASALVFLGACAPSHYRYVRETRTNIVFKLPNDWQLYEQEELLTSSGIPGIEGQSPESILWAVGFEADRESTELEDLLNSDFPVGMARIRILTDAEERAEFSLSSLRNELIPVAAIDVEVVSEEEVVLENTLHGVREVFNLRTPTGVNTFNKTALIDPRTTAVFLLIIGCEADCYEHNEDVINDVVASYTIGGTR